MKNLLKTRAAKDPLKKPDGMIQDRYSNPPFFQETLEVIGSGVGSIELYEGRLDKNDAAHSTSFESGVNEFSSLPSLS